MHSSHRMSNALNYSIFADNNGQTRKRNFFPNFVSFFLLLLSRSFQYCTIYSLLLICSSEPSEHWSLTLACHRRRRNCEKKDKKGAQNCAYTMRLICPLCSIAETWPTSNLLITMCRHNGNLKKWNNWLCTLCNTYLSSTTTLYVLAVTIDAIQFTSPMNFGNNDSILCGDACVVHVCRSM